MKFTLFSTIKTSIVPEKYVKQVMEKNCNRAAKFLVDLSQQFPD